MKKCHVHPEQPCIHNLQTEFSEHDFYLVYVQDLDYELTFFFGGLMLTFDLSNNSLAIFWLSTPGPLTWIGPGSLSQLMTS